MRSATPLNFSHRASTRGGWQHRSYRTHRAIGNGDAFQAHNQGIGVAAREGFPNEGKVQQRQAVANGKEFKCGDLFEVAQY